MQTERGTPSVRVVTVNLMNGIANKDTSGCTFFSARVHRMTVNEGNPFRPQFAGLRYVISQVRYIISVDFQTLNEYT